MEQEIGFCAASDGVRIAYATIGSGPPVVYVNGWPAHLELEWEESHSRRLLEGLAEGCKLIRYDMRGTGLSDRRVTDFSLPTLLKDLEAVADHLEFERFALVSLGMLAGPIAISYAVANPARVTELVLSSGFVHGGTLASPDRQQALIEFTRKFGFPHFGIGDQQPVDAESQSGMREVQRAGTTHEVEAALLRTLYDAEVEDLLGRLTVPTLVMHGRGDRAMPFAQARELAAGIPGAKFVPFEGSASMPWARTEIITPEIHRFLGHAVVARDAASEASVQMILFTDMESSAALRQRLGDARVQELVRTHNSIVRGALQRCGGTEIKHTGDGIMASFGSTAGALECAQRIQREVESYVNDHADAPLSVYIGLNAGEPIAEEQDLFGTSVDLARRICDHAEPGQVVVSGVVKELAEGKGFRFGELGEVVPKGFVSPVRLYELRWREG